jgi:hypothetical protein
VRHYYQIRTWTFSSFNWIYESFYPKGIKVVPLNIGDYISPLALAVWIMDYATALPYGMKITTNSFCYKDVLFLCEVLREKYGIVARPNKDGDQWVIYIHSKSMSNLSKIVKPYMVPSMHYKLGRYQT